MLLMCYQFEQLITTRLISPQPGLGHSQANYLGNWKLFQLSFAAHGEINESREV